MVDTWNTVSWSGFEESKSGLPLAFNKRKLPFKANANALQTLDVWIPNHEQRRSLQPDEWPLNRGGIWIIYIHGGAWRDPNVTSTSFDSPVKHLLSKGGNPIEKVDGIASLNYSLSQHPNHPDNPSPPRSSSLPNDSSRKAEHPNHILDVLMALESLQNKANFDKNYILLGHSCGATLSFQTVMDRNLWDAEGLSVPKPKVIVGLNGLYDLPKLIRVPGSKHEHLVPVYDSFTKQAFSTDEQIWQQVSPAFVKDWAMSWPEGEIVALAQSKDDSLVPYSQTQDMKTKLQASASRQLDIREYTVDGDHNDLWTNGSRLAEILENIITSLYPE